MALQKPNQVIHLFISDELSRRLLDLEAYSDRLNLSLSRLSAHISLCNLALSPFWLYWTNFVAFSGIRCWFTLMLCFINNIKSNIHTIAELYYLRIERTNMRTVWSSPRSLFSPPSVPILIMSYSHSSFILYGSSSFILWCSIECAERQNMKKMISLFNKRIFHSLALCSF